MSALQGTPLPDASPPAVSRVDRATAAAPPRRAPRGTVVATTLLIALLLVPFTPLVLASVSQGYFFPQVIPETFSARAWRLVLDPAGGAWTALGATVRIALTVTALSLVIAIPAGRTLGTRTFRGKRAVELVLLAPVLVPTIAVAIGIHVVFIRLGLAGGTLGVVLVHLVPALPYVVLLSAGVFANAALGLEEQARSLGASPWRRFVHVTVPLVGPGLAVAGLFGFLVSWGQYALTLVIGGGQVVTLPILLFSTASGGDVAVTAATALFHGAPAVLLLVVTSRVLGGSGLTTFGGVR
ncbi:MAG: ABC transporter permease subunit [Nitriliruptoraceae bacterium]|nr:ABC transporter permease subunit [Nitriliruptoraceae bacterium]